MSRLMQPTTKPDHPSARSNRFASPDFKLDSQGKNNLPCVCNAESSDQLATSEASISRLTGIPVSEKTHPSFRFSGSAGEQPERKQVGPGRMSEEDFLRGLLTFEAACCRIIDERGGELPEASREEAASLARILETRSQF